MKKNQYNGTYDVRNMLRYTDFLLENRADTGGRRIEKKAMETNYGNAYGPRDRIVAGEFEPCLLGRGMA